MPERHAYSYAIVRVVPRVELGEFVNAGVIVHCPTRGFLGCRVALDRTRLLALCPDADVAAIEGHLRAFAAVCAGEVGAGPIAALPAGERFHWLVGPRSTVVQPSPVHPGVCDSPDEALDRLFASSVVRKPNSEAPRR